MRSRALTYVQKYSQNDVLAIPSADASQVLRHARARIGVYQRELNPHKQMLVARTLRSLLNGKERVRSGNSDADDIPIFDIESDAKKRDAAFLDARTPPKVTLSHPHRHLSVQLQSPAIPHYNPAPRLKSAAALTSLAPLASACLQHPVPTPSRPPSTDAAAGAAARKGAAGSAVSMTPESLPWRGASTSAVDDAPSPAPPPFPNGKRPFRPPRVQVPTKSQSQQQWQQKETNGSEEHHTEESGWRHGLK
ncbi:hypothetical protein EDB86DRAFT_3101935 [Lactarius hatsudake]|nr:hypothetical protein EDB86DRAFT_3101935 [Lactarius hatsudake]